MTNFSKMSGKEIREMQQEWSTAMFTATKAGADINSVMLYTPLIQGCQNELMGRFIKKSTWALIFVGILTLAVSTGALVISNTALRVSQNNMPDSGFFLPATP